MLWISHKNCSEYCKTHCIAKLRKSHYKTEQRSHLQQEKKKKSHFMAETNAFKFCKQKLLVGKVFWLLLGFVKQVDSKCSISPFASPNVLMIVSQLMWLTAQ